MTFRPLNRDILNKRTEKAQINSINFYQDGIKKFNKTAYMFRSKNKKVSPLEESSDSSFNDNGQEEILKKIICLNYPILNENNKEKKDDDKNELMYLKKLIAKNKKENMIIKTYNGTPKLYWNPSNDLYFYLPFLSNVALQFCHTFPAVSFQPFSHIHAVPALCTFL